MYDEKKLYVVVFGVIKSGVFVEVFCLLDILSVYGYEGKAFEWMECEVMWFYEKYELKLW